MLKLRLFCAIVSVCFISSIGCNQIPIKRSVAAKTTVSIIVPCVGKHFKYISSLLDSFAYQTSIPEEIIISVSQVNNELSREVADIKRKSWPFKLIIIEHQEKRSAGENRNFACQAARGNVFICQDADDLPHPQRVEIIRYIFEHYYVDILMHGHTINSFIEYKIPSLVLKSYARFQDIHVDSFHQGNIAIAKEVFKKVQWPTHYGRGEDQQFNRQVCAMFTHIVTVQAELLLYRHELSSWKKMYQSMANKLWEVRNYLSHD